MISECSTSGTIGDRRIRTQDVAAWHDTVKEGASRFIIIIVIAWRKEAKRAAENRQREVEERGRRGGQGFDCTEGNHRETETFQGGTGWFITRLSKTVLRQLRSVIIFLFGVP